jgi:hypothetical protein
VIEKSQENAKNTPSVDELLNIIQVMREEMTRQRSELETQRREIEQIRQVATSSELSFKSADKAATTTSRRRMLRKLVAGAAGVAALGATAAVTTTQVAQAGTFDFNGLGSTPQAGSNASTGMTTIQPNTGFSTPIPLLKIDNTVSTSGSGTNPDSLSIGLLAKSTANYAVYGWNTSSSGTAPTGIIGISGNNGVLSDSFFSNSNGGVVGTSYNNPGTMGLSQTVAGVEGRSVSSYGVKGITSTGVGGAFGIDSTNANQGAPLRLGLRDSTTPPSNAFTHNAGEISLDKVGRLYVCQAGNNPTPGSINPSFNYTNPGFPGGLYNNQSGPNWRFMAPMVVKTSAPKVSPTAFDSDNDLHVQGELWLDSSTGKLYVNKQTGSTNGTMLTNASLTNQLPVFVAVTSPSLHLLNPPSRFIDTRAAPTGINDIGNPIAHQVARTYTMTSLIGRGGATIPTGATGIVGNVTVAGSSTTGYIQLSPSTPGGTDPSTLNFNVGITCNSFTVALSGTGGLTVMAAMVNTAVTVNLIIDITGYYF